MDFQKLRKYDRMYLQCPEFESSGLVKHAFTTCLGGVSHGKIDGLNLGFRVGDHAESVQKNYQYIAQDLNLNYNNMVLSRQTHTDNIRIVTKDDAGKGLIKDSDIFDTDGLVTDLPDIPLVIFSADCTPILLLDIKKKVVGAVHAGWRGTVKQIAAKAIKTMIRSFGSNAADILAAIGPSIGPCCFETEWDTAKHFLSDFVSGKENEKFFVNLWAANQKQLMECGVLARNIFLAQECTKCHSDIYYSYRAQREKAGRMAAIISLI